MAKFVGDDYVADGLLGDFQGVDRRYAVCKESLERTGEGGEDAVGDNPFDNWRL